MKCKLTIPLAIGLLAVLFMATSQLSALQFGSSADPSAAKAAQLNAKLKDLDLERQRLMQDEVMHKGKMFDLRKQIQTLQEEQFKKGISSESFDEIVRTLQTQRVQLMIDLAGLEARQRAVQEYSAAKNANPLFLEVIDKMQEQVKILKEASDHAKMLHERGSVSMGEYREAQRSLLAAEIQLRQMQLSNADSPEQSGDELRRIALERAEKSARLNKTSELLQDLESVPEELSSLSQLKSQQAMMWDSFRPLEENIRRVQAEYYETSRLLDELMKKQADDN